MKLNLISGLLLLVLAVPAATQVTGDTTTRPPTVPVEKIPRTVEQPKNGREVAVLSLALEFSDGELQNARKLSSKRINSFAPKVFLRKSGDWKVTINGREKHSFFVNNPGWREAEPDEASGKEYEWIPANGVVEWSLAVPLYKDGQPIVAHSITISDVETGRILLEMEI
ncbi:hypothetical protein [Marinimicrobium agarilyticum]|uniref:hypothetical protein n=1 Tax=Marinimicrobium agarilyticum TaxID=306546 RepID=UPI00048183E1|nr:hypothetical protein [Marinimicrobium agarilyticum]